MLFVFAEKDSPRVFWMKDMTMAIDIIWIDDNKVIQIDEKISPEPGVVENKLKRYIPNQTVDFVLEVAAGFSERYDISVGTTLSLPPGL